MDKLQREISNIFYSRRSYGHIMLPRWCLSPRVSLHIQYRILFRQCGRTAFPRRNTGLVCMPPSFKGRFTAMNSRNTPSRMNVQCVTISISIHVTFSGALVNGELSSGMCRHHLRVTVLQWPQSFLKWICLGSEIWEPEVTITFRAVPSNSLLPGMLQSQRFCNRSKHHHQSKTKIFQHMSLWETF